MKIDLHCHSKHSRHPVLWIMQKLGCPESFTEPVELYQFQRTQGMDAVTITDHNVIDGCLDILHLPDTFMGCEYTTYFPSDGCKVHILAYEFTEAQHKEITEARKNIYDLVAYFRAHKIRHACAHPLFGVNDRLSIGHIEQLILLFKNWELNGDIAPALNDATRRLFTSLTPALITQLADKHGIEPHDPEPWIKHIIAGQDDHSSLNLARSYTEVPGATTLDEFWDGIAARSADLCVYEATPEMFARNVYAIAYQFYKSKMNLEGYVNKDLTLRFVDNVLHRRPEMTESWASRFVFFLASRRRTKSANGKNRSLVNLARSEAEKVIHADPKLLALVQKSRHEIEDPDATWFDFTDTLSNKMLTHVISTLAERLLRGQIFDLFQALGSAGSLYATLAPYFVGYAHFTQQRFFADQVLNAFGLDARNVGGPRVAHFTDTFYEVNGVARTLQQQVDIAQGLGYDYRVVTCPPADQPPRPGVVNYAPVGTYEIPEYPEVKLLMPPLLRMLRGAYDARYTHLHVATPGPVGLAGLAIARILRLPVAGTYHTAFPQYGRMLTGDIFVEDILWRAMIWFYEQLDAVYVPSRATGQELIDHGLNPDRIRIYPRGCDVDRFHPAQADATLLHRYGVRAGEPTLLYVGRVSKEKNLHILQQAYRKVLRQTPHARLVVVGDGPYRATMERELADTPAVFTGYLTGDDLPALYGACDLFVFPSTTDTFGNVVLEAQACGTPVVVTDQGGPAENLLPGETGHIVPGEDAAALAGAIAGLLGEPGRLKAMGLAARAYMESRGFQQAFGTLYNMYCGGTADPEKTARAERAMNAAAASALAL